MTNSGIPSSHSFKPIALALIHLSAAPLAFGVDGTWDGGGTSGIWGGANNWNPNSQVASGIGATVTFASAFGSYANERTILLNIDLTLGQIIYTDPGTPTGMAIAWHNSNPGRTLTLNVNTGSPTINVTQADRTLTIGARLGGTKGFTKMGPGTLLLAAPGSAPGHTFSGATVIQSGILSLADGLALSNSVLDTANSIAGDASNGLKTAATALTLGGLSGNKDLASVFTTTSGGYSGVTALTLNPVTGATAIYSGTLADGAAGMTLSKSGAGTQVLAGTISHTGGTTVTAGTLLINSNLGSAITVNANATLGGTGSINGNVTVDADGSVTGGDGSSGTLTLSNLTFNGAGKLNVGTLANYTGASAVKVTGALTLSGGAGSILVNLPAAPVEAGIYHLLQFGSGITDASGFTLGTVPVLTPRQSGGLQLNGNNLDYVVTSTGAPYWTGLQSTEWSTVIIASSKNWKLSPDNSATDYLQGDNVFHEKAVN